MRLPGSGMVIARSLVPNTTTLLKASLDCITFLNAAKRTGQTRAKAGQKEFLTVPVIRPETLLNSRPLSSTVGS